MQFLAGYITGLATLLLLWIVGFVFGPWARALTSGARVTLLSIVGMRLRRSPPHLLIDAYVRLSKKGDEITMEKVELCYLAHKEQIQSAGDLVHVVMQESTE